MVEPVIASHQHLFGVFTLDVDISTPGDEAVLFDANIGRIVYFNQNVAAVTPHDQPLLLTSAQAQPDGRGGYVYHVQIGDMIDRKIYFQGIDYSLGVMPDQSQATIIDTRLRAMTDTEINLYRDLSPLVEAGNACQTVTYNEPAKRWFWAQPDFLDPDSVVRP